MANNKIQIKRSTVNAVVTGLSAGELAFTQAGNVFFIGAPDGTSEPIRIGGAMIPGTLTANQALVANTTSGIDKVITANLYATEVSATTELILSDKLKANGQYGNNNGGVGGMVLTSNSLGGAFWNEPTAGVAGHDKNVQFNNGGSLAGSNGMNFTSSSNTFAVNGIITAVNLFGTTVNATTVNATSHTAGSTTFGGGTGASVVNSTIVGISTSATVNTLLTTTSLTLANATFSTSLSRNQLTIANTFGSTDPSAVINTTFIGVSSNTIVNASLSPSLLTLANSTGNVSVTPILLSVSNSTTNVQTTSGTITLANATFSTALSRNQLTIANTFGSTDPSAVINTTIIGVSTNATSNAFINSIGLSVNSVSFVNTTGIFTTGTMNATTMNATTVNATSHISGATYGGASAAGKANSSLFGLSTSTTANAELTPTQLRISGNSTSNVIITTESITVNAVTTANTLGFFSNNFSVNSTVLTHTTLMNTATMNATTVNATSHTSGATYGGASAAGKANSSLVGLSTSTTANVELTPTQLRISGNSTSNVIITTQQISVNAVSYVNTTGLFTTGTVNAANISVGTSFIANSTELTFTGANIVATTAYVNVKDLNVSGNLVVTGDIISVNVATLEVEDPLIQIAKNQSGTGTPTDNFDIGFYGTYGSTSNSFITGLFRDRSDGGIYKLFHSNNGLISGSVEVNTAPTSPNVFNFSTLEAYFKTGGGSSLGGLFSNVTHLYITANDAFQVNLTANTLSVATALGATSGGTGHGSYATGDLLVANTGNILSKLALGTSGKVLQSTGTALVYDDLDGGTF